MLVSKLVPMLVAGGITAHSGPAIKERLESLVGAKDTMVTKQRMMAVVQVARLDVASGEELRINTQASFRSYVRANVRIRSGGAADSSKDFWGKPLHGLIKQGKFVITSSGPDKKFSTKDDIKVNESIYDY